MFDDITTLIGQLLSLAAVATGFVSFQMKTPRGILFFQILTALLFSGHYALIGAMTASALNFVAAVKCVAYYIRNQRNSQSLLFPIFFTVLVFVTSLLTWDGWYSIFIMAGLLVNSVGLALSNPQTIRKLTLIKSPLCLTYNVIVLSSGGTLYEIAIFVSAILGIWKNRNDKAGEEKPKKTIDNTPSK